MKISRNKFKILSIITITIFFGLVALLLFVAGNSENNSKQEYAKIVNGQQVIDLVASISGYSPRIINASANTETILKVSTKNSFGCVNNLTIPKLDVYENLEPTGEKEIKIGSRPPGDVIEGLCSGGINSFIIKFS